MKKKETPFLDFYKESMMASAFSNRAGAKTDGGLCSSVIGDHSVFELLMPTAEDLPEEETRNGYWGFEEGSIDLLTRQTKFTPLRQTIVLFCAAINEEL